MSETGMANVSTSSEIFHLRGIYAEWGCRNQEGYTGKDEASEAGALPHLPPGV